MKPNTVCEFCDKSFANAFNLRRHLLSHSKDSNTCPQKKTIDHDSIGDFEDKSKKTFNSKANFINHERSHNAEENASSSSDHHNHNNTNFSSSFKSGQSEIQKDTVCKFCDKSFANACNLKRHLRIVHKEQYSDYTCGVCDKTFQTQRHFVRHAQHFHRNVSKIQHTCKICSKTYCHKYRLTEHFQKNHADKLPNQTEKDRNTNEAENLSDDDEEEQEEKKQKSLHFEHFNNKCAICHKVFHFKPDFIKHARRYHRNSKAFQCLQCSSRCTSLKDLYSHCRIHNKVSKSDHICKICFKSFRWKSNLILHSNVHSDERLYCCRLCESSYKSEADMAAHEKAHLDEMYQDHLKYCFLCGNGYKHMTSLRIHQRDKHNIRLETKTNLYYTNFNLSNNINTSVAGTTTNKDDSSNYCDVKDEYLEDCQRNAEFIIPENTTTVTLDDDVKKDEEDVVIIKQDVDDSIDEIEIKDILEISATEYIPAIADSNLTRKQNYDQATKLKYIQRSIGKLIMFENKCAACDKMFNFQKDLIRHVQQYHRNGSAAFKCSQCSSRFCSINSITIHHSRVHSYDNIFTSKNVENIIDDDDDVDEKYEIKEETSENAAVQFPDNTCTTNSINDILTSSNIAENGYLKESSNTNYLAQKPISEKAKESVKRTRLNQQPVSVQKSKFFENKCAVCDKIFNLPKDFIKHALQYHRKAKAFQCPLCGARFNSLQATISHVKIHENLKTSGKYKNKPRLNQNRSSSNKANENWKKYLKKQENIQLNSKKNDCAKTNTSEICEKIDNDGKTCKFCSRSFSHGEYLKVHIDLHHKTCDTNSIQKDANGTIIQEKCKKISSTDQVNDITETVHKDSLEVSECQREKLIQNNDENNIGDDKICEAQLSFTNPKKKNSHKDVTAIKPDTEEFIKTIEVQWLPNNNDKKYDYIDECHQPGEPNKIADENDEQKLDANEWQMEKLSKIDQDNRDDTMYLNSEQLKCDICDKIFKNKTKLRRHIGNVHIHNSIYIINDSESDSDHETIDIKEEPNDAGNYTDQCSSINYEMKDDLMNLNNSDQQEPTNIDQDINIEINTTDQCAASSGYETNNQSLVVVEYQIENPDQLVNVVEYLNITDDHQEISEEMKSNLNAETNIECIESMNIVEYVNSSENKDDLNEKENSSVKDNAEKTTNLVEDKPGIEVIYLNNSLDEVKNVVEVAKNEFVVYDEAIIPESVNSNNHSSPTKDCLQNPIADEEDNQIENSKKIKIWRKHTGTKRIILTDNKCAVCKKIFQFQSDLTKHVNKFHRNGKGFKCRYCSTRLSNIQAMMVHYTKNHKKLSKKHSYDSSHLEESLDADIQRRKTHICDICSKSFTTKARLMRHSVFHTAVRAYSCHTCNKTYKHLNDLRYHEEKHKLKGKISCEICFKVYDRRSRLETHLKVHLNNLCGICNMVCKSQEDLLEHVKRLHKPDALKCNLCSYQGYTLTNFKRHNRRFHEKCPYQCSVCDRLFKTEINLKKHEKLHFDVETNATTTTTATNGDAVSVKKTYKKQPGNKDKKYKENRGDKDSIYMCEICSKTFNSLTYLKGHIKIHKGESPVSCPVCFKGFLNCSTMKHHLKVHYIYKCVVCDKNCYTRKDLFKHVNQCHPKHKAFKCRMCEKIFFNIKTFYYHIQAHKNYIPEGVYSQQKDLNKSNDMKKDIITFFTCGFCCKLFENKLIWNDHVEKHFLNECQVCNQICNSHLDLTKHAEEFHPSEMAFKCRECDTFLSSSASVYDHMKIHKSFVIEDHPPHSSSSSTETKTDTTTGLAVNDIPETNEIINLEFSSNTEYRFYQVSRKSADDVESIEKNHDIIEELFSQILDPACIDNDHVNIENVPPDTDTVVDTAYINDEHVPHACIDNDHVNIENVPPDTDTVVDTAYINDKQVPPADQNLQSNQESYVNDETEEESNSHLNRVSNDDDKKEISKKFLCGICYKLYSSFESLRKHSKTHAHTNKTKAVSNSHIDGQSNDDDDKEISENVTCEICSKSLSSLLSYRQHLKTQHADIQYSCEICSKTLSSLFLLRRHLKSHDQYACAICSKRFTSITRLKKHLPSHNIGRPYDCSICGKTFKREDGLEDHKIAKHNILPESEKGNEKVCKKQFTCEICSTSFPTVVLLKRHSSIHTVGRPYVCSLCGKAYKREEGLESHYISIHNLQSEAEKNTDFKEESYEGNESAATKKHTCKICLTSFSGIALLKSHLTIHTVGRPFACSLCGKAFKREEGLENHKLTKHSIPSDENADCKQESNDKDVVIKNYNCEECSASFSTMVLLKSHLTVHTVGRPYACSLCDKAYKREEGLENHIITVHHLPFESEINILNSPDSNDEHKEVFIQKFTCDICSASFSNSILLKSHLTIHTVGRPHECKLCGKAFKREEGLENHKLTKHSIPSDENADCKQESSDKDVVIKNYNCEECSASFSTMALLKSHLTVHTVGRPYACSLCDKAYKREEGLENHMITVHHLPFETEINIMNSPDPFETEINIMNSPDPNDEDKEVFIQKFTCDICSVSFSNSILLKSHLTIHVLTNVTCVEKHINGRRV